MRSKPWIDRVPDGWVDPSDSDPHLKGQDMAQPKMLGRDFLDLVCETLGVDPGKRAHAVEIKADCGSAVEVSIKFRATVEEGAKIAEALAGKSEIRIGGAIDNFTVDSSALEKGLEKAQKKMAAFVECATCAAKPGSPRLCDECLRRRAEIEDWQIGNQYICERCNHVFDVFDWYIGSELICGTDSRKCPKCRTEFVRKFRHSDAAFKRFLNMPAEQCKEEADKMVKELEEMTINQSREREGLSPIVGGMYSTSGFQHPGAKTVDGRVIAPWRPESVAELLLTEGKMPKYGIVCECPSDPQLESVTLNAKPLVVQCHVTPEFADAFASGHVPLSDDDPQPEIVEKPYA